MPPRNPSHDREINFVGGRILDAEELNHLQQIQEAGNQNGLGALYNDGGATNITATVNGYNVVLSATNSASPMPVFLHGNLETVQPATLSYSPSKISGRDSVYLNYVLWRVTLSTPGTINDPALQDVLTGEPIGEIGQLELTLSSTDGSVAGTGVAIDPVSQLDKNANPIVVFTLPRGDGSVAPALSI